MTGWHHHHHQGTSIPTSTHIWAQRLHHHPTTTTTTNESWWLIGWLFWLSTHHVAHHHHQWVPVTRWLVFLAFHPPHGPPLPPTSPGDSLVGFSGFPPTTWPTSATNESQWLVGGLFWLSTHHAAHLHHQWVPVTCWWSTMRKRGQWQREQPQTTPDASFGP